MFISSFLSDKHFEPFTAKDIEQNHPGAGNAGPIIKGFLQNKPMAMPIGWINKTGKYDIADGFTRAGIPIALKIPIKAILLPIELLK